MYTNPNPSCKNLTRIYEYEHSTEEIRLYESQVLGFGMVIRP
jgi:hypothetical protein